jgi:deoxycytidine triphosphate deaminase
MSVLDHSQINERFDGIFQGGTGRRHNIQAAKYYLTLGSAYVVHPDGRCSTPALPSNESFTVEPGQTAIVSTAEMLTMPRDLIGLLGSRFDNSEQGVLFFGGMIVDPGYGLLEGESYSESEGEPLTFSIANVGSRSIELRPLQDQVASLAFLSVIKPLTYKDLEAFHNPRPRERREQMTHNPEAKPTRPLGFVEELSLVRSEVDKASTSVKQVVLFGVIVLAVTMCAAVATSVLALSGGRGGPFSSSDPEAWKSLGLTLGVLLLGVFLTVGLFMSWTAKVAERAGINRRVNLGKVDD